MPSSANWVTDLPQKQQQEDAPRPVSARQREPIEFPVKLADADLSKYASSSARFYFSLAIRDPLVKLRPAPGFWWSTPGHRRHRYPRRNGGLGGITKFTCATTEQGY
jgi:hypothetical protein